MSVSARFKRILSTLSVPVMLTVTGSHAVLAAEVKPIEFDYLALGDSLAAGVTPYNQIDDGYTDFLAEKIEELGFLGFYTKRFAVPGYTTEDVLDDIQDDVEKGGDHIRDMIDEAEVITLDAGANDLLKHLTINQSGVSLDPEKVPLLLEQVQDNTREILKEIKIQNFRAKVYVMGYYNAFPYIPEEQQKQLLPVLDQLNKVIEKEAKRADAAFIPTAKAIGKDFPTYLPNPQNIHLSEEGYEVVADAFWKEMKKQFLFRLTTEDRSVALQTGEEHSLTLTAIFPSKQEFAVEKLAQWSSSNEEIASVKDGVVTAHKNGTATITAKYEGKQIKIIVKVIDPR
ncbi:MAG TPA: GDSL-type esterase/lipase family protein [Candidatus Bathyarchaeia archaeon]|nr:GDSL-type esterase/lipase family protein [Candidatus Bathyarchaeia archaeon]